MVSGSIPDISDRMLAERLKELEQEEIVIRSVIPETPVRVEYALTPRGRALEPAVEALSKWAERWLPADADDDEEQPPARKAAAR